MIKRTPADIAFSKCIRERDNYTCQLCGSTFTAQDTGLHCSHFHGRAHWSVRFDKDNAEAHCYGCHAKMEGSPHDFTKYWLEKMGEGAYELLLERKRDTGLAKMYRQTKGKGMIAGHFRDELARMQGERCTFEDKLEFEGFY